LRPLQILYLNVITDVFPALALGLGEGNPDIMQRPPRKHSEAVLTRKHWSAIGGWSGLIAVCVLAALLLALHLLQYDTGRAVTISFLTLAFAKLWFVFNLREPGSSFLNNAIVRNVWVWLAIALCIGLLFLAVFLPGLSDVLKTVPPTGSGWLLLLGISLVPFIVGQTRRVVQAYRRSRE
jgi:Ca2+-transporting ATPase